MQLERTQWWTPERLRAQQDLQRNSLVAYCHAKVPYYRERLEAVGYRAGQPISDEQWWRLPRLDRTVLQEAPDRLRVDDYPKSHGRTLPKSTSGSSGRPVQVLATELTDLFWDALSLRALLWAKMDPSGTLAAIRGRIKKALYPEGSRQETWGPPIDRVFDSGPAVSLSGQTPIEQQVEWLVRRDPDYLVTNAHTLCALARHCRRSGIGLPRLKAVQTFGGVIAAEDRDACWEAWQARLCDTYSTEEVGYAALQCPESDHLHVQSESVLLEIVDDENRPCPPGEQGQVLVTPLHSFAMPLLRYELGDLAIAGGGCACGRGLPVISEILGRSRDMLTLPDGSQIPPSFVRGLFEDAPIIQFQLIQTALDKIEARIVVAEDFLPEQERAVYDEIRERLPASYRVTVTCVENIPRTEGGKYLDFKSEIANSD